MKRSVSSKTAKTSKIAAPDLIWSHFGRRYRVTVWPDVRFERENGARWTSFEPDPSSDVFASASVLITRNAWAAYLEFMPTAERDFVLQFTAGRLAALTVLARCPTLLPDLAATPALTPLVAAHVVLRGPEAPRWEEITAVHERGGLFDLLAWLGFPATKTTLAVLSRIADPDLARRLFAPLRAALWEPAGLWELLTHESLTEHDLVQCSHSLAA
jgi:hypothetical protein